MKASKHLLGLVAALLFATGGMFAQTTSGGTTSGGMTSGGTTTGGTTTGTTSTGTGTTTGTTSIGTGTSTGTTSTGTSSGSTSTGTTSTGTGSMGDHGKAAPHTPNDHASDVAKAVQGELQKFDASRDQLIAQRKALLDKLAAATTDADRQAILAQLQALKDQREQLGKQIRDDLKNLREQRKGSGG